MIYQASVGFSSATVGGTSVVNPLGEFCKDGTQNNGIVISMDQRGRQISRVAQLVGAIAFKRSNAGSTTSLSSSKRAGLSALYWSLQNKGCPARDVASDWGVGRNFHTFETNPLGTECVES